MCGRGTALRAREEAEDGIHRRLERLSQGSRLTALAGAADGFKAAYLVDADRVDAFAGLVGRLADEGAEQIRCTGPWPPYSFVSGVAR